MLDQSAVSSSATGSRFTPTPERARAEHDPADARGRRRVQQPPGTVDVQPLHLRDDLVAAPDADPEGQVQHGVDAVAGRADRLRVAQVARAPRDVEPGQRRRVGAGQLQHPRPDALLVELQDDVVAEEPRRPGDQDLLHPVRLPSQRPTPTRRLST